MNVTKVETKESTKHCCGNGFCRKDSAEHEGEGRALIDERMTENNLANLIERLGIDLLKDIADLTNLGTACDHVRLKKGAGGIDGMKAEELTEYFEKHGEELSRSILDGTYCPKPVRRVEIPKDNGKKRNLGIPIVIDRVVQQAIAQQLSRHYEMLFSDTSYGFRPNRSCHQAILKSQEYLNEGKYWVVDMDLEKFFDTVNKSKMIQILSKVIKDGRVISLIQKFLNVGVVIGKRCEYAKRGIPQGGPLSPLLANIMLNELDTELTKRGHKFVRYADDLMIFCGSKASAQQTLEHIIPFIEKKLLLKVNREKTTVAYAGKVTYLGYGFYKAKGGFRMRLAPKTRKKIEAKIKQMTDRNTPHAELIWPEEIKRLIVGWVQYYRLADMRGYLRKLDAHLRRRIRMNFWKRWKKVRTKYRNLRILGLSEENAIKYANSRKGYWRVAGSEVLQVTLSNKVLREKFGFYTFEGYYDRIMSVN